MAGPCLTVSPPPGEVGAGGGVWGGRLVQELLLYDRIQVIHVITGVGTQPHGIAAGVIHSIWRGQSKRGKLGAD